MHTFQPYPIDLMEMNPFTKIGKEWMLITAGDEKKANTMTAAVVLALPFLLVKLASLSLPVR